MGSNHHLETKEAIIESAPSHVGAVLPIPDSEIQGTLSKSAGASFGGLVGASSIKSHIQDEILEESHKTLAPPPPPSGGDTYTTSGVYTAIYSSVSVYEMMCRGIAVMRRQKDSFLNATQVLKVANIDKGKRTKILEKEILNKLHEKVQGGYGKIPFERGMDLARHYNVYELLKPLFTYSPTPGVDDQTPTKEQMMAKKPSANHAPSARFNGRRQSNADKAAEKAADKAEKAAEKAERAAEKAAYAAIASAEKAEANFAAESRTSAPAFKGGENKRIKMDQNYESPEHTPQAYIPEMAFGGDHFFEFEDQNYNLPQNHYASNFYMIDGYHHPPPEIELQHRRLGPNSPRLESSSERHRAEIMALFLNEGAITHDILSPHSILAGDFDIDMILDDQGHTALHWAAALANTPLLRRLLQKGARMNAVNFCGESALIRSVMVAHNYDQSSFIDLITTLKDVMCMSDKKDRTVLHHICLSASIKGRVNSCTYYMRCLLEFYAKCVYDEQISSEILHQDNQNSVSRRFQSLLNVSDICGDTAVNITARLGNRQLFDMLVEAGADVSMANYASLKPSDYGFHPLNYGAKLHSSLQAPIPISNKPVPISTTVLFPSIKNDHENSSSFLPKPTVVSEKSQAETILELQGQLSSKSKEITDYRKEMEPLKNENMQIPELKGRIAVLEKSVMDRHRAETSYPKEVDTRKVPGEDTLRLLREALSRQKAIEAHLNQELVQLRTSSTQHEKFCKRIISACCNVPLANVEELLQPLLDAVESEAFDSDLRLVTGFMESIRDGNELDLANVPSSGSV